MYTPSTSVTTIPTVAVSVFALKVIDVGLKTFPVVYVGQVVEEHVPLLIPLTSTK